MTTLSLPLRKCCVEAPCGEQTSHFFLQRALGDNGSNNLYNTRGKMSAAVSLTKKRKGRKKDLRSGFREEDEPPRDKVENQGARAQARNRSIRVCPAVQ